MWISQLSLISALPKKIKKQQERKKKALFCTRWEWRVHKTSSSYSTTLEFPNSLNFLNGSSPLSREPEWTHVPRGAPRPTAAKKDNNINVITNMEEANTRRIMLFLKEGANFQELFSLLLCPPAGEWYSAAVVFFVKKNNTFHRSVIEQETAEWS